MRLVKSVTCELLPIVEDSVGGLFWDALVNRAGDELRPVFEQFFLLFLGDRFTQVVGFGGAVASQAHHREHQLFLVHRVAVSLFKYRL